MWRLNWALASFLALKLSTASAKSSDSTWLPSDRPMLQLKNDWKRRKASIVPLNSGSVYNMPLIPRRKSPSCLSLASSECCSNRDRPLRMAPHPKNGNGDWFTQGDIFPIDSLKLTKSFKNRWMMDTLFFFLSKRELKGRGREHVSCPSKPPFLWYHWR